MNKKTLWIAAFVLLLGWVLYCSPIPSATGTIGKIAVETFVGSGTEPNRPNPYADYESKPDVNVASLGKNYSLPEAVVVSFTGSQTEWQKVVVSPSVKLGLNWVNNNLRGTSAWDANIITVDALPQEFASGKKEMVSGLVEHGAYISIFVPENVSLSAQKKFFMCAVAYKDCTWERAKNF